MAARTRTHTHPLYTKSLYKAGDLGQQEQICKQASKLFSHSIHFSLSLCLRSEQTLRGLTACLHCMFVENWIFHERFVKRFFKTCRNFYFLVRWSVVRYTAIYKMNNLIINIPWGAFKRWVSEFQVFLSEQGRSCSQIYSANLLFFPLAWNTTEHNYWRLSALARLVSYRSTALW